MVFDLKYEQINKKIHEKFKLVKKNSEKNKR